MKRTLGTVVFILAAAFVLSACGGGGGGGSAPPPPPPPPTWQGTLISRPAVSPIIAFTQSVVSQDTGTYNEAFPGCANIWALNEDLSLNNGFDRQFDYALALTVGTTSFPLTQTYNDLSFYTPYMGTAEGVKVATVSTGTSIARSIPSGAMSTVTGTYAAFLNATSDSRLQTIVDLTTYTTPTHINISWDHAVRLWDGAATITGYVPGYSVVVRDLNGTFLKNLQSPMTSTPLGLQQHIDINNALTAYAGQKVVLSFEAHSTTNGTYPDMSQAYVIIDNVAVRDVNVPGSEYVTNGTFETGMTGTTIPSWTMNTPQEVQNITSSSQNLAGTGLDVTRSFYTVPNKLWARWVDMFENNTAATIATKVTYTTLPGVSGTRIIYDPVTLNSTPTSTMRALTLWDAAFQLTGDGTRDVGLVFGNANSVDFISDDGTGIVGSTNPFITVTYNITVPAGGRVAIVNFVLMGGKDTGRNAGLVIPYDPTKGAAYQATEIDTAAKDILSNFRTVTQYHTGMTQEQFNAVINF